MTLGARVYGLQTYIPYDSRYVTLAVVQANITAGTLLFTTTSHPVADAVEQGALFAGSTNLVTPVIVHFVPLLLI